MNTDLTTAAPRVERLPRHWTEWKSRAADCTDDLRLYALMTIGHYEPRQPIRAMLPDVPWPMLAVVTRDLAVQRLLTHEVVGDDGWTVTLEPTGWRRIAERRFFLGLDMDSDLSLETAQAAATEAADLLTGGVALCLPDSPPGKLLSELEACQTMNPDYVQAALYVMCCPDGQLFRATGRERYWKGMSGGPTVNVGRDLIEGEGNAN